MNVAGCASWRVFLFHVLSSSSRASISSSIIATPPAPVRHWNPAYLAIKGSKHGLFVPPGSRTRSLSHWPISSVPTDRRFLDGKESRWLAFPSLSLVARLLGACGRVRLRSFAVWNRTSEQAIGSVACLALPPSLCSNSSTRSIPIQNFGVMRFQDRWRLMR